MAAIIINLQKNTMETPKQKRTNLKPSAGNSPAAQERASEPNETLTLPSGAVAEFLPFKGKHVKSSQRLANGDETKVIPAIIAVATLIDGKSIMMEDLDEMDGRDVIKLMGHYQGLF